ncbi:SPW repeat-containing protein [Parapedobacter luteus]|uniref:SPW repeat-containing protein n=1 Tax=Parapedobacter luteus TaxID=623280 RepID=A0A1T5DB26_9SPHI|nr:SPW repeat protein [Parapedobacter luteus]SKB68875.1 SPW repeat-containing protein [Parapedobacter luteus]
MRFIGRRFHAVLDYMAGLLLIAAPWLFGFTSIAAATWVAVIIGVAIIGMSLFTDYEGGVVKEIPMSTHLAIDVFAGLVLAASPWLFGFADQFYGPHLILGILEAGAGLFTVSASQHAQPRRPGRQGSALRGTTH